MRKFLLIAGILINTLVFAQTTKMTPASTSTKWVKNTKIDFVYSQPDSASFSPERRNGKDWFFEFKHTAEENPEMSDDEKTEIIGFQIAPVKGNSFTLKNKQLQKARAYYLLGCFCKDRGFKLISKGSIVGKKINATTWMVTIDVTIATNDGQIQQRQVGKYILSKD